ncbi:MAG TPA: hypothetical protein VL068_10960 [Microthrixaceae bacterium]|nr:hypothetical protein [Microthrixaceae bacterium]
MEDRTDPPEQLESGEHTVAFFASIDKARHAVLALERNGIDSSYITVARKPASEDRVLVDKRSMAWMAKLAVLGTVGGALLGAVIGILIVLVIGAEGTALVAGVISGVIFGAFAGGFCLVALQLPVNEESYDMFGGEPSGSDWIAVSGPSEVREKASSVLRNLSPLQMQPEWTPAASDSPNSGSAAA